MNNQYDPDKESSKKGHFTPIGLLLPLSLGALLLLYYFLAMRFGTLAAVIVSLLPIAAIIGFLIYIIVSAKKDAGKCDVRPEDMPPPIDYDTYMQEQKESEDASANHNEEV
ncbi:MAG: hypothetical protein K5695_03480 [Oscillospiraceae bacterium]|nr:hypothetical protein [Oscillospiraceae bacterium]